MLASIHPLGEWARNMRWGVTASAYIVGSTAGGAALGGLLGLVGRVAHALTGDPRAFVGVLLVLACAAAVALDLGAFGLRIPTLHRQVNEDWLNRYRGWVYGVSFGFQLGLGVVTIVTTATVYLTFAAAFLVGMSGWAVGGAVIGTVFGLVRSAPILLVARARSAEQLRSTHRRLQAAAPAWRALAVGVPGVVVLAAGIGMAL